jgi:predicted AAA+ superfamily ATPase
MTAYLPRVVDGELSELLGGVAALVAEGAKAVGKTSTASSLAATVHELDDPAQLRIARADPQRLLVGDPPVLIDEWQRLPEVWDLVRRAVDEDRSPGRFLLAGSSRPGGASVHSGAGRIVHVRMRPMTLAERGVGEPTVSLRNLLAGGRATIGGDTDVVLRDYTAEIVRGGFPGMRHLAGRSLRAQLDGYLAGIVEHDFEELGHVVRRPASLRRWLAAYAAASSTTATFETIRRAASGRQAEAPSRTTVEPWIDVLQRLWVVDPVAAWAPGRNHLSELTFAPKHQLVDPALAARLVGVDEARLLEGAGSGATIPRDGTLLGALFESLVTLNIRVFAQAAEARVGHLRTKGGRREIDLIIERDDQKVVAVEVKLTRTIDDEDVQHLRWLAGQLGDDLLDAVVITTGPHAYRRPDGIAVVPAALLGP